MVLISTADVPEPVLKRYAAKNGISIYEVLTGVLRDEPINYWWKKSDSSQIMDTSSIEFYLQPAEVSEEKKQVIESVIREIEKTNYPILFLIDD